MGILIFHSGQQFVTLSYVIPLLPGLTVEESSTLMLDELTHMRTMYRTEEL